MLLLFTHEHVALELYSTMCLDFEGQSTMPINFDDLHLGFFDVKRNEDGSFCSGLLVTNSKTQPLSFIGSKPIKPTTIQRILYGKAFEPYIRDEVLGTSLFKASTEKIDVVFVRYKSLLKLRKLISPRLCCINSEALTDTQNSQDSIEVHSLYPGDKTYCHEVYQHLREILQNEVLEPFDRIDKALDELMKQPH